MCFLSIKTSWFSLQGLHRGGSTLAPARIAEVPAPVAEHSSQINLERKSTGRKCNNVYENSLFKKTVVLPDFPLFYQF